MFYIKVAELLYVKIDYLEMTSGESVKERHWIYRCDTTAPSSEESNSVASFYLFSTRQRETRFNQLNATNYISGCFQSY